MWNLRRPDGTSYPHNQLSAAAAALGEGTATLSDSGEAGKKQRETAKSAPLRGGEKGDTPRGGRVEAESHPVYPGSGLAAAVTPRFARVAAPLAAAPLVEAHDADVGVGVRGGADGVSSRDEDVGSGQGYGRGEAGSGGAVGFRAVVGAIGLAAVAVVMVLLKGLFGLGSTSPLSEPSSVSIVRKFEPGRWHSF